MLKSVQKNILNLKTTVSILPFGYKVKGGGEKELNADQKTELWQSVLAFAQQYTASDQHDICGYQNAPDKGTLLQCNWTTSPKPTSASVHTSMVASSSETLTFQGRWALVNVESVNGKVSPDNFFFGVEVYAPRRRFLFGIVPTMTEQFFVTVSAQHCSVSIFGRALQNPILAMIPLLGPYQKVAKVFES